MDKIDMKKIAFSLMLLSACVGCTSHSSSVAASSAANSVSSPEATESTEAAVLTPLQNNGGINWGAGTENGFYYVNTAVRSDGSCNLMYADYESGQIVYLCSQANCTHDTAGCPSYLMPTPGGVLPERVGDKIILFYMSSPWGDETEESARVESIHFDGSGRKTVYTFKSNETPRTTMATDGESLYFMLETVENDSSVHTDLAALDTVTGTINILRSMNHEQNEWIWGCSGQDMLIYRYVTPGEDTLELLRWNYVKDSETVLYRWDASDPYPFLYNDALGYQGNDGYWHLMNLETGSDYTFTAYTPAENSTASIQFADTWGLLLREVAMGADEVSVRCLLLDTEGNVCDWNLLMDGDGDPQPYLPVYSLNDQEYLVYVGDAVEEEAMVTNDGTSGFIQVPGRRYSIMAKSDYQSGTDVQKKLELKTEK